MLLDRLASDVEAIGGKVRVRVAEFLESLRLGRQLARSTSKSRTTPFYAAMCECILLPGSNFRLGAVALPRWR
jgi:hypothetical protein